MSADYVVQAQREMDEARAEFVGLLPSLSASEGEAWANWVDAQVREFVRTQPDVLQNKPEEQRAALKAAIAKVRDKERAQIESDVLKLESVSPQNLRKFGNDNGWGAALGSHGEEVLGVIRRHGFEIGGRWGGTTWFVRKGTADAPALTAYPLNDANRLLIFQSIRRLVEAETKLKDAEKRAAGESAVGAWDSI